MAELTTFRSIGLAVGGALILLVLYLLKLNHALKLVPEEVKKITPHRWTAQEVRETYERIKRNPIDWKKGLPAGLNRRYVVIGASGLVGGDLVHLLLLQGHRPGAIRMLDFRPPHRPDMLSGSITEVDYVQTDISHSPSVQKAFAKPWPHEFAHLPLTVFHTAAALRFAERHPMFYSRIEAVNVTGTKTVMDAAKAAGADVFIATSSGSVAMGQVDFAAGGLPWVRTPKNYYQIFDESDQDKPLKRHEEFFGNYGAAKAAAERMVCKANSMEFRTGCIRPANSVYGELTDQVIGPNLRRGRFPTWVPNYMQGFVASRNVGIGHLLFENALVRAGKAEMPRCAGRAFNIADPNPPIFYGDFYTAGKELVVTPFEPVSVPPVVLLALAYVIEGLCVAVGKWPWLKKLGLREPAGDMFNLQPAVFSVSTHSVGLDAEARKKVEDGGLGYNGVCTTIEGICEELLQWNNTHGDRLEGKES